MRAERLIAVLMLLKGRERVTAAEIARELEVSERTVFRDIEALSLSGVPVYAERGRHGGFALLPGYRTDLTGLTLDEAIALLAGSGRIDSAAYAGAMRKVTAAIPQAHRARVTDAAQRVLVRPEGFVRPAPTIAALPLVQRAVLDGRRMRVNYRRNESQQAQSRVLDPIGLIVAGEVWYLVALRDGAERIYRLSRMVDVELLDEPAQRPTEVDLEEIWQRHRAEFRAGFAILELTVECARAGVETLATHLPLRVDRPVGDDRVRCVLQTVGREMALRRLWMLCGIPELELEVIEPTEFAERLADRAAAAPRRPRRRPEDIGAPLG